MVGLGRVELPTRGLGNRCSIHLSYRPRGLFYRNQQNAWHWGLRRHVRKLLVAAKCHSAELSDGLRFSPQRMMETIFSISGMCVKHKRNCQRFVSALRLHESMGSSRADSEARAQTHRRSSFSGSCWPSLSSHGGHPAVGANNGNIHQVLRKEPHLKLVGSDHVGNE